MKEGRKERAERSVHSLHQCSSFTRPWPILVHLELSFCRNSMPTLRFAYENGLDESQLYYIFFFLCSIIWILTMNTLDTFFLLFIFKEKKEYLNMSEPFFYFNRSQYFNLNKLMVFYHYVREHTSAGNSLNVVVCIEHRLIRRPSHVTCMQTLRMHAERCYLPWTRWLGRLMYATIEQHEYFNCRRSLPYVNWNVKIDRSYNSIQFAPLLRVNE
jgi:hypothetical protein